jgi:hypothetical protein
VSTGERRRSPRVAVSNHPAVPHAVVDVSLGGLSVALPYILPKGSVQDVELTIGDADVVLRVRVAHRRRETGPNGLEVFVTGLEFLADVTGQASRGAVRVAS